jgi:hypothetical protein
MQSVKTTQSDRAGSFWDAVRGEAPLPPAAATLGMEFIDVDPDRGTIELAFTATEDFINPFGNVLGAYLAAMLYDRVCRRLRRVLGRSRPSPHSYR